VSPREVFVDFDGTITDIDTFDALVRRFAGDEAWNAIDAELESGRLTLRDALERQANLIRVSRDEAFAHIERTVRVDPTFAPFVARAHARGDRVTVLSSGLRTVITHALARAGLHDLPVVANDADFSPEGWMMRFIDPHAENGTDKAARVRSAKAHGVTTVFCGDGISDFAAALVADRVFAKRNRALKRYGSERGLAWTSFASFDEVERALYG
jgi:HAD superfamily phosphoserine phosphatase-like hydrolase